MRSSNSPTRFVTPRDDTAQSRLGPLFRLLTMTRTKKCRWSRRHKTRPPTQQPHQQLLRLPPPRPPPLRPPPLPPPLQLLPPPLLLLHQQQQLLPAPVPDVVVVRESTEDQTRTPLPPHAPQQPLAPPPASQLS